MAVLLKYRHKTNPIPDFQFWLRLVISLMATAFIALAWISHFWYFLIPGAVAIVLLFSLSLFPPQKWDPMPLEMLEWLDGLFTKIVVSVDSELELLEIHHKAMNAGIPCALIQDSGATEFHGVPTYTCCAIGPAEAKEIDPITKHLKLL